MSFALLRRCGGGRLPDLVLFDLDGTLIDSVPDIAPALDAALRARGLPAAGAARVRTWVGRGARELVRQALAHAGSAPDAALLDATLADYLDHYQASCAAHTRLYPGALELLQALRAAGVRVACVTNKAVRITLPVLAQTGIAELFDAVVGGDSGHGVKPDPGPLRHVLDCLGVPRERVLMVGDSRHDVGAARALGIPVIGVADGYNHGEDIRDAAPDAVVGSLQDLL